MGEKRTPAFNAFIPATVRYDEHIPANAKLLYADITALLDLDGICREQNAWFAEQYKITEVSVSRLISKLSENGHIAVTMKKTGREIKPTVYASDGHGLNKNDNPHLQKCYDPLTKKLTPINKNDNPPEASYKEDIYISNTTDNNSSIDIENKKKESKKKEKNPCLDEKQMQGLFYDWISTTFPDASRQGKNELWKALDDFYAPREQKKQEPQHTRRGFNGLCGQLLRKCKNMSAMIDALQQATAAGWKSIYPREQPEAEPQPTGSTEYF